MMNDLPDIIDDNYIECVCDIIVTNSTLKTIELHFASPLLRSKQFLDSLQLNYSITSLGNFATVDIMNNVLNRNKDIQNKKRDNFLSILSTIFYI